MCCKVKLKNIRIFYRNQKRKFFNNLDEENQVACPICLEDVYNKDWMYFSCNRHEVHKDCYEEYKKNHLNNI